MNHLGQVALVKRLFQIRGETPTGKAAVDLESTDKHHVGHRRALPPRPRLGRLRDAAAQVEQQRLEATFFGHLGFVVQRPVLLVGWPRRDLFRVDGDNCPAVITLADDAGGVDVLARLAGQVEVVTGTGVTMWGERNFVIAVSRLRGDDPHAAFAADLEPRRYLQAF